VPNKARFVSHNAKSRNKLKNQNSEPKREQKYDQTDKKSVKFGKIGTFLRNAGHVTPVNFSVLFFFSENSHLFSCRLFLVDRNTFLWKQLYLLDVMLYYLI